MEAAKRQKGQKTQTESGLEGSRGPESSPCISTQYPQLSPKIIEEKKGKPREGQERHKHNKQMSHLACSKINP